MQRHLELRALGLLALFAVVPLLVLAAVHDDRARASVLHVGASFAVLLLAFRVMGKRELSRLSPFELVTLMLIPEILSNTVQGEETLLQSLAGLCTILVLVLTTSLLLHRFDALQNVLESPPTVLVNDGKLLERAMNRERIAPDELFSEMRKQGMATLAEVKFAVLESGGNITFVRRGPPRDSQRGSDSEPGPGER